MRESKKKVKYLRNSLKNINFATKLKSDYE